MYIIIPFVSFCWIQNVKIVPHKILQDACTIGLCSYMMSVLISSLVYNSSPSYNIATLPHPYLSIKKIIALCKHRINLSPSVTIQYYTDPSVNFSKECLPFVALSIALFIFAILPPALHLTLYPFLWFRSLLFKCLPKQSIGPLNIFVEKFNNCYQDGLDGERDMRSLAALYFFI